MLAHTQDSRYFARMASSLGDKEKILPLLEGFNVLDVGAGGGELASAIHSTGRRAFALDGSFVATKRMREAYGNDLTVLHGLAHEVPHLVPESYMDTVVCSSIFHEVYSYGAPETGPYSMEAVKITLSAIRSVMKPGARLIIRDGIMPSAWDSDVLIRFKDEDGIRFWEKYYHSAPFASWVGEGPRCVRLHPTLDPTVYAANLASAMEFLYTLTWGWGSSDREMKELYGLFTEEGYCDFLEKQGFEVEWSGQYLQPGYYTHLKERVDLLSPDGTSHPYPASNCLLVARRR